MESHMKQYAKAVVAFFTALGTWGVTAAPDGYSQAELWGLCGVVVATAAVFQVRNEDPAPQITTLTRSWPLDGE